MDSFCNFYKTIFAIFVTFLCLLSFQKVLADESESELNAVSLSSKQIAGWLKNQIKSEDSSVGIFDITTSSEFSEQFKDIIEAKLITEIKKEMAIRVVTCEECRLPQVEVRENKLLIKKKTRDDSFLLKMSERLSIDYFITINTYRSSFSLIQNVILFDGATGEIQSSETFKVAAIEFNESDTSISFKLGAALGVGGPPSNPNESSAGYFGGFTFLQELGMAKGGLAAGIGNPKSESLFYLAPVIGKKKYFKNSYSSFQYVGGLGFGTSDGNHGIALHGSFEFLIGSFTGVGTNLTYLLPIKETEGKDALDAMISFYIIFNLGK